MLSSGGPPAGAEGCGVWVDSRPGWEGQGPRRAAEAWRRPRTGDKGRLCSQGSPVPGTGVRRGLGAAGVYLGRAPSSQPGLGATVGFQLRVSMTPCPHRGPEPGREEEEGGGPTRSFSLPCGMFATLRRPAWRPSRPSTSGGCGRALLPFSRGAQTQLPRGATVHGVVSALSLLPLSRV